MGSIKWLYLLLISLVIGAAMATLSASLLKDQVFKIADDNPAACTGRLCDADTVPRIAGASGGYKGFPLRTSNYYCNPEDGCVHVNNMLTGPIKLQWINVLIWSGVVFIIALLVLLSWSRRHSNMR